MALNLSDEISWRRNWKPEFASQAWNVFQAEGNSYWIKYYFEEVLCSYKIAVTDYERIWMESVDSESSFSERAKKLNPNVEARSTYLLKHLHDCLSGSSGVTYSVKEPNSESNQFILRLKSKLPAGIPFSWEFYCSPGKKQMMKDYLVFPLLSMIGELQRRQDELFKILKKKDYEIEEYKNAGAVLPRKLDTEKEGFVSYKDHTKTVADLAQSFETQPFIQDDFTKRMTVSEGFLQVVENCSERACVDKTQELYKQVMIKRDWIKFKNSPAATEDGTGTSGTVEDSQGFGLASVSGNAGSSWDAKLPPSLLVETSPVKRSPLSSPSKSPNKTSPEKSPLQDTELVRRENLRKRLADEADKKKSRKKKKLKI